MLACSQYQSHLGSNFISTIKHYLLIATKKCLGIINPDKIIDQTDLAGRIDFSNALAHDLDFAASDRTAQSRELPIDIRTADMILIHQGNHPYPGTRQGLCAPAAHPPNARHNHMGLRQPLNTAGPKQPLQSTKTSFSILHHDSSLLG